MASGCLRHKGIKDQGLRCQIDFQPRLYNLHFHLCACCGWFRSTWEQRLSQWVRNRAKATGKVLQKVKGSKHRSTEACEKSSTKEWNPRVVHISESHRKSHCNNAGKCPGTQRRYHSACTSPHLLCVETALKKGHRLSRWPRGTHGVLETADVADDVTSGQQVKRCQEGRGGELSKQHDQHVAG